MSPSSFGRREPPGFFTLSDVLVIENHQQWDQRKTMNVCEEKYKVALDKTHKPLHRWYLDVLCFHHNGIISLSKVWTHVCCDYVRAKFIRKYLLKA